MGSSTDWRQPIHTHFGWFGEILTTKLSQTLTWFVVCDQGSTVGLHKQDYKSLCAAAMICVTLVNIQTHSIVSSLCDKLSQLR